jgi:polar amino acid transport system substrate-binding protein
MAPGLVCLLALAGCGSGGTAAAHSTPASATSLGVAVPAALKTQGTIKVGVACDYPPFGYTGINGDHAGFDTDVARTLATYAFGDASKVSFTCVTPQNRIPYLQTHKIDLIVSTLGYTQERAKAIDYSAPYFTSGVKLLVPKSSGVTGWTDIHGKTIITTQGTTASTYLTNCYADSKQLLFDNTSDDVSALTAGRAAAFAEDSTLLLDLALSNSNVKVVGVDKATTPWGIGIFKGDSATKQWVDAALKEMQSKDTFWAIFTKDVGNQSARQSFSRNMPRPGQNLEYTSKNTLTDCS